VAHDVFISYRSDDKEFAERLCAGLERRNITCWMAPRNIDAGREWAEAIVEAIQHCKSFVLVLSSNSLNARQISREAELADRQGLPIFTFRVENVDPPPGLMYFLGNLQWLDAFGGNFDAAMARLGDIVATAPASPRPPEPMAKTQTSPPSGFPGRNIAIFAVAAVAVLLGLTAWFIVGRKSAPPAPASASEAKDEAERFLNALKASNYSEAWNLYTAAKRASESEAKMAKDWTEQNRKYGPIEGYQFNRCTEDDPSGIFTCAFKLDYGGGQTAQGKYVVERDGAGQWGVSSASHTEPRKAP
jgi:hypothetical protein